MAMSDQDEISQRPSGSAGRNLHRSSQRNRLKMTWSPFIVLLSSLLYITVVDAAFVEFHNCLAKSIVNSQPRLLQFDPLNVTAVFNTSSSQHNLNVTVYGNVTGKATDQPYPSPDDPSWSNPNDTFGKIPDVSESNNKYTTLFTRVNLLSYTPWDAEPKRFCTSVLKDDCPLAPAFYANSTDLDLLPAFSVAHDMGSSYAFTSLEATLRIQSGDASGQYYSCVTAAVTPDLGGYLNDLLRYLPLAVLIVVGIATIAASVFSPWGSADIFNWSSNFGRDEDLLRLVTPGFGDCLQYIQFVVLTASLSLNYPGFYQPAISRIGWSSLMFNESFVSGGNGTQPVVDGIYQYRPGTKYGLDRMSQLVGMTSDRDIWAAMIVWLVAIVAGATILTQLGFAARWVYRQIAKEDAEDLRSKNGPFTVGNVVRIALNYFILPWIALSFYQLLIAAKGPAYSVALAAVSLVVVILFSVRLLLLFTRTRPRSFLFDDLLTVLAYGPLYNTYCDDAATFAMIPLMINLLRGIAIGAVQPSGVAQVVLLAISEIILILTINLFRPFPSATSMNIYHTCFSAIRLITILLSIAFVPSLGVEASTRGWMGYAILVIHACTLVFGFFLNAVQTLIEVIARLAGAGGRDQDTGGATRGGLTKVFGMRQLSRRLPRRDENSRHSGASNAAMLNAMDPEQKQLQEGKTRSRSVSAASGALLDSGRSAHRLSSNIDARAMGSTTPDRMSRASRRLTNRLSGAASLGGIVGLHHKSETKDPYYRPPRRNTVDRLAANNGLPITSLEGEGSRSGKPDDRALDEEAGEGASTPLRQDDEAFEDANVDSLRAKTDYAVREVDFYYGVRGAALSSGTRKLKTGPADPTGPVSTARGWFKGLLGGKTKEKTKGFEVVRSARAPPPGLFPPTPEPEADSVEPYHDEQPNIGENRSDPAGSRIASPTLQRHGVYDNNSVVESDDDIESIPHVPAQPPSLPLVESVGGIELPSRVGSEASKKSRKKPLPTEVPDVPPVPAIPRKSSRRQSGSDSGSRTRITQQAIPPTKFPDHKGYGYNMSASRIPFSSAQSPAGRSKRWSTGAESTSSSLARDGGENVPVQQSYISQLRNSGSALGAAHGADIENDRPSTMGFVQQHRASDHIHYNPEFEGSTAEVHGGPSY